MTRPPGASNPARWIPSTFPTDQSCSARIGVVIVRPRPSACIPAMGTTLASADQRKVSGPGARHHPAYRVGGGAGASVISSA